MEEWGGELPNPTPIIQTVFAKTKIPTPEGVGFSGMGLKFWGLAPGDVGVSAGVKNLLSIGDLNDLSRFVACIVPKKGPELFAILGHDMPIIVSTICPRIHTHIIGGNLHR